MVKGAISKYIIFIICLSLSFMVFLGSPFIYAAETGDEPFDVQSSPVGVTDLTNFLNLYGYNLPDFSFLTTSNHSVFVSGSTAVRHWTFELPSNFNANQTLYCIGAYNEDGLTLVDGYRYVIKMDMSIDSTFSTNIGSSGSNTSSEYYTPSFVLYSEYTDSGDFISHSVPYTSYVDKVTSTGTRRIYTFDFTFDAASLISDPFKGDSPTLNSDGTYSFSGYGIELTKGPPNFYLTKLKISWIDIESYVFSPEDYSNYELLTKLWNIGPDSSYVQDDINQSKQEADQILNDLDSMDKPDPNDQASQANPFDIVSEFDFNAFGALFSVIVNNPLVTGMIVLVCIFGMISYVFFGKR